MTSLADSTPSPFIAERLGTWVSALHFADVPEHARSAARHAMIDVMGVAFAGSQFPFARITRAQGLAESRAGASTIIAGAGAALTAPAAARLNATSAHVLDFDANFNVGMVFAPAVLFPALLAVGEEVGATGADLLTAFVAGTQTVCTLAECLSEQPYRKDRDSLFYKGWFNSAVLGPIGAAAAVSRLLGLDAGRTAHAIAIATVQAGGLRIAVGSDMKPYLCARASEIGLRAALLARDGGEAPLNAFEGHRGFIQVINGGAWTAEAFEHLGAFQEPGTSYKLYPACSSVQAAAEALEFLLDHHKIDAGEVATVRCDVTRHIASNLAFPRPANVTQAQFSMPFALGCLLARGRFTADLLTQDNLEDPTVQAAMGRVEMHPAELFEDEEAARNGTEATRVTVTTHGGRTASHLQAAATGKPINPMPEALLERKFLRNVAPFLSPDAAETLLQRLRTIEDLDDVRHLFAASPVVRDVA
ncbi:hypothetical protein GCM10007301_30010 [Azorhizobium oxalatiphilum]|uniref:MmgE/PrpD family protein n=1 Tax=Azorhizobium oxalatiphilum TaxID=980631 RepID=A0A917C1W1_9HYPH|nr:MmgE/PrpD family protein [Azorhizobium oxalatiphilum]GGF68322.1 hypothetical protein GCM10007301_30010 [Azorhizobium oxalatiphilum]